MKRGKIKAVVARDLVVVRIALGRVTRYKHRLVD